MPRSARSLVVVPVTRPYPETLAAVRRRGAPLTVVPLTGTDAYYHLLLHLWQRGGDVTIVEQDMAPTVAQLDELDDCPEPWCGYAYNMTSGYQASLGCTRFRAGLMAAEPDLMRVIATYEHPYVPAKHFIWLSDRIAWELESRGYTQHVHWPPVAHLNPKHVIPVEQDRGWCDWPACRTPHAYRG